MHAFLAEHRLRLFPDEMFVDVFPTKRGRPSVPADVIATVLVLWRNKLRTSDAPQRIFDALRAVITES